MPVSLMKIILMQLPIQGTDFFYSNENIPLAPACLKAVAAGQGKDVVLLPQHLMPYGSDQAILRFLLDGRPDIVGMSCYLWNLEPSLFLARQLHRKLPMCTVVLSGPEITPHNEFLLAHGEFDVGVVGQGEQGWEILLKFFPYVPDISGLLKRGGRGQWYFTGINENEPSVRDLSSPYLWGCLDSHPDKILWLETVRGCLHQCAHCHYHKQFKQPKPFPLDRVDADVGRGLEKGIEEIVFLDPCFAGRPGLEKLRDLPGKVSSDRRLRFHAELNAEDIDFTCAEKLGKIGFSQVEVGLQTIHRETLKMTHRRFRPRRFLQGMRSLQGHGIEVMGDLIAGLPGDKLEDIHKRMDWVLKHDAFDSLMLYPLSLLASPELHPHRSFLVFSRTQGLIWKWPDPRESHSLELPDGQKTPSHPVCCVATSGEAIPEWFTKPVVA